MEIVDTHVHIWDFDRAEYSWLKGSTSILNRTYRIDELENERMKAGITAGVLVQAANNLQDTDYMLEVAATTDWIKGVVGWLPLMNPDETERLLEDQYGKSPYFKGVRHLIHDEPDTKWLLQHEVLESLGILAYHKIPYDVVGISPEHISTALEIADELPDLMLVFDHLNQPPIVSGERFGKWGELMKQAASHKSIYAKLSGLGTASKNADWSQKNIQPYIEFIIEQFGVERVFCGGDWPVCLLAGPYSRTWKIYCDVLESILTAEEQHKVLFKNAMNFYKL